MDGAGDISEMEMLALTMRGPAFTPVPPADARPLRARALELADEAVMQRSAAYGVPGPFCENVALRWSLTLGHVVTARDVVRCLIDLKQERAARDRAGDSAVDLAGYAALLFELDGSGGREP